jgi:hypothetical protein
MYGGKPGRKDYLSDLVVDEDNIKMNLLKKDMKMWAAFLWYRIWTSSGAAVKKKRNIRVP